MKEANNDRKRSQQAVLMSTLVSEEIQEALVTLANAMMGMSAKHVEELVAKAQRDGQRDRLLQAATEAAATYTLTTPLAHCEIEAKFRMQGDREKISVTALNKLRVDTPTREQIEAWMDGMMEVLAPVCGDKYGRRAMYQVYKGHDCYIRVAWPHGRE